ncbi:disulfide bond formation protein DsbA [Streptomyces sp. NPDC018000]|uniref:mycothiol-dependent nitroreductase Rv2466c family protein n=1 Tax=Streptomyces sp. NPDC018000 TaxID=3365028 RepID=UPI0037A4729C
MNELTDSTAATAPAAEPGAGPCWTVDFWLDPACPLTRNTARWITHVSEVVPLQVTWRAMSLSILNEHRDDDPEGDPNGYLWIPARIAAAVQTEHGHNALGMFYEALWTTSTGVEREWIDDPADALQRAGLPTSLAEAGTTTAYDRALRASHRSGVNRVEAEIGTPILTITMPTGDQHTYFGPVIQAVPPPEEAVKLWEALLLITTIPAFRELKG